MNTHITALPQRKPRTKTEITQFLRGHCRYATLNTWNGVSSYAVNIKVHRLNLTHEQRLACYNLMECEDAYQESNFYATTDWFARRHNFRWKIGFNGRSGGYAVLYQGRQDAKGRILTACAGTDEAEDFAEWDLRSLKDRLELVWDFDDTVEEACSQFLAYALETEPTTKTIWVSQQIMVAKPRFQTANQQLALAA